MTAIVLPMWTVPAAWMALCWIAVGVEKFRKRRSRKVGVGGSSARRGSVATVPPGGLTATADADIYPRVVKTVMGVPRETVYAQTCRRREGYSHLDRLIDEVRA